MLNTNVQYYYICSVPMHVLIILIVVRILMHFKSLLYIL